MVAIFDLITLYLIKIQIKTVTDNENKLMALKTNILGFIKFVKDSIRFSIIEKLYRNDERFNNCTN